MTNTRHPSWSERDERRHIRSGKRGTDHYFTLLRERIDTMEISSILRLHIGECFS